MMELFFLQISTAEHTMFFDIKMMGKECFEAGIREVLESPNIMKASDFMFTGEGLLSATCFVHLKK